MYYKSVNRGLSFTKAGIYLIAFVMIIGLLAIVSSVNGLYLFLSLGLSILIMSGVLSEKVMQYTKINKVDDSVVDAHSPFDVRFSIENLSKSNPLFGVRVSFFTQKPKVKLIGGLKFSDNSKVVSRILPKSKINQYAQYQGIKRGYYDDIYCFQSTGFPFGLLEKYKFSRIKSSITVIPRKDEELLKELNKEALLKIQESQNDNQFFCHRGYIVGDSLKTVDWKKNANRPLDQWVTKEYRSESDLLDIAVVFSWEYAKSMGTEDDYELYLSRVRTCFELRRLEELNVSLYLKDNGYLVSDDEINQFLANLPTFDKRMEKSSFDNEFSEDGYGSFLEVRLDKWFWNKNTSHLEVG